MTISILPHNFLSQLRNGFERDFTIELK